MPQRMDAVLATSPPASTGSADAPRLLAGTGNDQTHLLVVCTAERGLCGGFNSSIARLARDHANRLIARRQGGQDPLRRQEGLRHPAPRCSRARSSNVIELRDVQASSASPTPTRSASEVLDTVRRGRVRRLHAVLRRVQVGDQRRCRRRSSSSRPKSPARPKGAGGGAIYEYEPDEESILADLLPRNLSIQIFRALLENAASRAGRQDERHGQRHAQRRRDDRPLTLIYNRTRQAQITKELIEIISGAEAL